MKHGSNDAVRKLALDLLEADHEDEVIKILKRAGYWDDQSVWRLYGDKEGNFAQVGNQQSMPEAALVEKIVNSCDSMLMLRCLQARIDPESDKAPDSVRAAVAQFFEGKTTPIPEGAGSLSNWLASERTKLSRSITIAATGDRAGRSGQRKNMCITIADEGEGQSPNRLPETILSLNAKNKQRIRFVQGKFNMGGSGALRFCGKYGLQLVISKRNPELAKNGQLDESSDMWGLTVVRREEPGSKSGEPLHSEFTYLAPVATKQAERPGVLTFSAASMPLMPEKDEPYKRAVRWGTAIKLYEYETNVGQSNVLMKDGLMYALERLLPEIALPVRIHECRGYKGEKERSFETTIAGLAVRLEDGKGDSLESGFPLSASLRVDGVRMSARIYAFKEASAKTYLRDEGVIFQINGQAHGYLQNSIFTRKTVGLSRLRNSILVLVECSGLTAIQREDLFMSSRDRLSKKPIRYDLEAEIEDLLKNNRELRRLQQERRARDIEDVLGQDKPLEEAIQKILRSSPTLRTMFVEGKRLPNPFSNGEAGGEGNGAGSDREKGAFVGKRHPTFFRFPKLAYGRTYRRAAEASRRCRIKFETDVENGYFDRRADKGSFELEVVDEPRKLSQPTYTLVLEDGIAHLNMTLPDEVEVGDRVVFQVTVADRTLLEPFVNVVEITVIEKQPHPRSDLGTREKRGGTSKGNGSASGITLPTPIPVRENDDNWKRYSFLPDTACHVISDLVDGTDDEAHTFYVNVDNRSLKTEMKYSKQEPRLLEARFMYGNILLGLAMLHDADKKYSGDRTHDDDEPSVQDRIRHTTEAIAPVLLPMIDNLSGLTEDDVVEQSVRGEDL